MITTEITPNEAPCCLPYFDKLPVELILPILDAVSQSELNPFKRQKALISLSSVSSRFRNIQPLAREYAIGSKLQMRRVVAMMQEDRERGMAVITLLLDFSADIFEGRGPLLAQVFDVFPCLQEIELRIGSPVGDGRRELGMEMILGSARAYYAFLQLRSVQAFTARAMNKNSDAVTEVISSRDVAKMFLAFKNLSYLHLPNVSRFGGYDAGDTGATIALNSKFFHLAVRIEHEPNRAEVKDIVSAATNSLNRLEIFNFTWLSLESIFTVTPINLKHLTCVSKTEYADPPTHYLDETLPRLVNLQSLHLGVAGYTTFAFLNQLPRLKWIEMDVVFSTGYPYSPAVALRISILLLDFEAHLVKDRLDHLKIRYTRSYSKLYSFDSLKATCNHFGIPLELVET